MPRIAFLLVICGFVATSPRSLAGQEASWAGKAVMAKAPGLKLRDTAEGQQSACDVSQIEVTVLEDLGNAIKVRQRDTEGWLDKKDAVLLDDAIPYFTDRLKKGPKADWVYASRGFAWAQKGDFDRALLDLNEAINLSPANPSWRVDRGNIYNEKAESDKAINDFTDAIRLDAHLSTAFEGRADALFGKHEYDRAIIDCNEALRLDPRSAIALNIRGGAFREKHNLSRAIEDYTKALQLVQSVDGFVNRGMVYDLNRQHAEAISDYMRALRMEPKCDRALNALAWLMAACPTAKWRDGKKAVRYSRRACELSKWKDWEMLDTYAVANAEAGNFPEALKWEEKVLAIVPDKAAEQRVRNRIKLFEQGKPYHEEP